MARHWPASVALLGALLAASIGALCGAALVVARAEKPQAEAGRAGAEESRRSSPLRDEAQPKKFAIIPLPRPSSPPASDDAGVDGNARREEEAPPPTREAVYTAHEETVAAHYRDGRDPVWSTRAEAHLKSDFESDKMGLKRLVSLVGVDCRMTSCVATVEWNDAQRASSSWQPLVQAMYSEPCATAIALPPDAPPGQPLRAHLLLDCTEARASEL